MRGLDITGAWPNLTKLAYLIKALKASQLSYPDLTDPSSES